MNIVLDASAIIAFFRDEAGAQVVADHLRRDHNVFVHALNLCEVYYDFSRASGAAIAEDAINDLFTLGVTERNDMQPPFWRAMGRLKAQHSISLADCATLTLATNLNARLLTADRHELEPLTSFTSCELRFIR